MKNSVLPQKCDPSQCFITPLGDLKSMSMEKSDHPLDYPMAHIATIETELTYDDT